MIELDNNVPCVFFDTGVEFPEIIDKVKEEGSRVTWYRPKHSFYWAVKNFGFPLISKNQSEYIDRFRQAWKARDAEIEKMKEETDEKLIMKSKEIIKGKERQMRGRLFGYLDENGKTLSHGKIYNKYHYYAIHGTFRISNECCNILKKYPAKAYYKETGNLSFIGTKAVDSNGRMRFFMDTGCFNENGNPPQAFPIHFWNSADISRFMEERKLIPAKIYKKKFDRSGCVNCGFGLNQEKKNSCDGFNRFERMSITHPKLHDTIMGFGMEEALDELDEMTGRKADYSILGLDIKQQLPLKL
jgi:3'-phosphoadenosine 5'-phosphosulfate sulfotransferase (PAPS reductase)/FAD synthetase